MSASVAGPVSFSTFPPPKADLFVPARRKSNAAGNSSESARAASVAKDRKADATEARTAIPELKSAVPTVALPLAERPESELLALATAGEAQALEILFSRHRQRLYRVALRMLRSKEDAEDAVQDALLSAYCNLASFQGRSLFSTWLTRIVVNASLIKRRSQRTHPELFLEDAGANLNRPTSIDVIDSRPDPEQALASLETCLLVEDALKTLAPAMRSAFSLRELQELSNTEAAEVSGVQMGAFKSRITRARNQLSRQIDHYLLAPLQKFVPSLPAASRAFATEESR
jgi:RNA polymerase sigma-70 factor (ECF subfamily)